MGVRVLHREDGRGLSVEGTLASLYRPGELLTGGVWDALGAPVCALERRERMLLVGLGGGSVARLLRAAAPSASIVGLEIDPEVVQAARAHFDLDTLELDVRVQDARLFLAADRGVYDLIVEDLFAGGEEGLNKPPWLPEPGLDLLTPRLAEDGLLVVNTVHDAPEVERALCARYENVVRIELLDCTNHVFVASRRPITARGLRRVIQRDALFRRALPNLRMRTVRSL